MSLRPWLAMPGALTIFLKCPSRPLRIYAAIQVISCAYYGLFEETATDAEYLAGYTCITVIATTLAGWWVVSEHASRRSQALALLVGTASLIATMRLLPPGGVANRVMLVQAAGGLAIALAMACTLPWNPEKLVPVTIGALFLGVAAFWFSYVLKPGWRDHWDWIAPVWMHTTAYSWLAWKLPWNSRAPRP